LGIPKIMFSPESHHPPHSCISGEIRHHPNAQLVVLFVVVSSFSRVVAISPSTPCLLLDKFTAPEVSQGSKGALRPFFPLPFSLLRARSRPPSLLRRRSPQSHLPAPLRPCRSHNRVPGIARNLPVQKPESNHARNVSSRYSSLIATAPHSPPVSRAAAASPT